jgi:hypothetical protein
MGLLCDYFLAPSDEIAASVGRSGPQTSASSSAASQVQKRGWLGRKVQAAHGLVGGGATAASEPDSVPEQRFPFVDGCGVEPTVQMGTLEALLTGRSYEDVDDERDLEPMAIWGDEGPMVQRLPDQLVAALASSSEDRLAEVAVPWSQTDEFWGHGDPEALTGLLCELASLARTAQDSGQHLYCWVCL